RGQKTLRQDSSNAGNSIVRKTAATAARLLKSDKLSSRQTPKSRLFEFPRGLPRLQFSAIDAVAKHLRYDLISAKKMDLKTMRLFLRPRFCIDAADVRLRIRIWTSSHEAKLTEQSQQSTRQTWRAIGSKRIWRWQIPRTPFLVVFLGGQ